MYELIYALHALNRFEIVISEKLKYIIQVKIFLNLYIGQMYPLISTFEHQLTSNLLDIILIFLQFIV